MIGAVIAAFGGVKNTIILGMVVTVLGTGTWGVATIRSQRTEIAELEAKIQSFIDAGEQAIPIWIAPWDGWVPTTPTETPTERDYDEVVAEFRRELEGMLDEEIVATYGSAAILERRDELVDGYARELRERLERRIAAAAQSADS